VVRRCWFAAAAALVVLVALVIAATGVKPGQANVDTSGSPPGSCSPPP
jgi:uncharacterized membrane protein YdfJ with MMPL/SSD domain